MPATGTAKTVWPAQRKQIVAASLLAGEARLEIELVARIILHEGAYYILGPPESSGYPALGIVKAGLRTALKIFLLAVIPLCTLGFRAFAGTSLYTTLFGLSGVESVLELRLTTPFGEPRRLTITPEHKPEEFNDLWKLIEESAPGQLPSGPPKVISRVALENAAFVTLPDQGKVFLVPYSTPVVALWARDVSVIVGTVGDIKTWADQRRKRYSAAFDLAIVLLSVVSGLYLEFSQHATT